MPHPQLTLPRTGFDRLLEVLRTDGFIPVGPTVRDGVVVYDDITCSDDLPIGWTDTQERGSYRLTRRADAALFGFTPGAQSWKRFQHAPRARLWQARRTTEGITFVPEPQDETRWAFIGARACEVHAIAIQDRALGRETSAFIVAVNCGQAGGTCFCTSMGTGPRVSDGFDLALTELLDGGEHRFVVEIGSERGAAVMARVPTAPVSAADASAPTRIEEATAASMKRAMPAGNLRDLLYSRLEHPRWDDVATRCLSCANCTMVCPTCFCTTVEDTTDLSGDHAERWERWDSCFAPEFSYVHGGLIRPSIKARYRQWLTHKLAGWFDQFGTSGCVGCGRCITWCPVGIDITEEVRALQEAPREQP